MDSSSSSANSLTSFLEENDISVTKFLDNVVSKFLTTNDITVTKFLSDAEDGIAVTKYLQEDFNDISVTKFMDAQEDGIAVTKYLDSRTPTYNTVSNEDSANKRNVNMTII